MMSGYREHDFDPNAGGDYGPPLRPFNWVQWSGVALIVFAIGLDLAYFAGRAGLIRWTKAMPAFANAPLILGVTLINSRREWRGDPAPELAAARRKWLAIVVTICAVILGAATILALKG